jgi:hypothetical protein
MPWAADGKLSTDPIDGGLQITEAEYASALEAVLSGKAISIAGGVLSFVDPAQPVEPSPPPPSLDQLKADLKTDIDNQAEGVRLLYITPGAGQAMTYQQKSDEAARYIEADATYQTALAAYQAAMAQQPAPDPLPVAPIAPLGSSFPLLSAEVGITAPDIPGVAQIVKAAFALWTRVGAVIEMRRLGTKAAIEAATTDEAARAAHDAVSWAITQ